MKSYALISRQAVVVACAVLTLAATSYVFAAPSAPPPGTTIPLPLNEGSAAQTKAGALTITGTLTANGGLTVSGGSGMCLGGVCKTAWPSSSVQVGNANLTGSQNFSFPANYNNWSTHNYYYYNYGTEYSYNTSTYWNSTAFNITIAPPSGGVPLSVTGTPTVRCYSAYSNFTYTPAPQSYPNSSSQYTYATGVTVGFDNANNIVVSGNCDFYPNNGYYYTNYGVAAVTGVNVRYIY